MMKVHLQNKLKLPPHPSRLLSSGAVRQVRSAVSLSREASGRPLVESVPGEEAPALQEADGGAMRLRAGEPFSEELSALWLGVQNLAFTLVCEAHENLLLAEGTLRNLGRHCLEQLHMLGQGSEVSRAGLNVSGQWSINVVATAAVAMTTRTALQLLLNRNVTLRVTRIKSKSAERSYKI